jgi:hemolysin III
VNLGDVGHTSAMDLHAKPLLRGIFHQYAFFAAVAAGVVLVARSEGARPRTAAGIYAASLALMFGASALYHRGPWRSPRVRAWMRRLDHCGIFLLIAGTYTPFALLAFEGALATLILVLVWVGAAAGIALNVAWIDAPRWLGAIVYVALGWVGVIATPQLFSGAGVTWATLIVVGGALYTLGALAYAAQWPNPAPAVFGFHEVFHVLVVAAAATQFVAVTAVVL